MEVLQIEGAPIRNMTGTTTRPKCLQRWHNFALLQRALPTCLLFLSEKAISGVHHGLLTVERNTLNPEGLR